MDLNSLIQPDYFLVATSFSRMTLSFWFFMITFTAFALLSISLFFGGHDHDMSHDVDHDVDHDTGHDADHGSENMSFLSVRVLLMFVSGFGAGGYFAARNDYGVIGSSLWGIVSGFVLAAIGYVVLNYFYRHQASSSVRTRDVVGKEAIVTTSILPRGTGEVACWVGDRQEYFPAQARSDQSIPAKTKVIVQDAMGVVLIVEPRNG
ncbi:MAG: NfeD family protein [Candidatus Taylorbacteria bacterium]|nr:NfeD family protein [Candidatus Taylorbacteria bacterium]